MRIAKKRGDLRRMALLCAVLGLGLAIAAAGYAAPGEASLVRVEDGQVSHSTDGGATWTQGEPEGFVTETDEEGRVHSRVGVEPAPGEEALMVQDEDGQLRYSTDGGLTWTDTLPEGLVLTVGEDGSIRITHEGQAAPEGAMLVKNEDGVISHSTDGGETWTEGAPMGFHTETTAEGGTLSWVGDAEGPGADAFIVRNENGKVTYSTDGGATWTDTAPEGVTMTEEADGSVRVEVKQ